jgi:hypothetical protein
MEIDRSLVVIAFPGQHFLAHIPLQRDAVVSIGIKKVDEMGSWLVPPIVIPVLIVIMVVVYGLYRAYS